MVKKYALSLVACIVKDGFLLDPYKRYLPYQLKCVMHMIIVLFDVIFL